MNQKPNTISFDSTLDQMVDAALRAVAGSDTLRAARRKELIATPLISAAALLGALLFTVKRITPGVVLVGVASAVVIAVIAASVYPRVYDHIHRRRIRGVVREHLAGAESVHCEIELRPDVLWLRQGSVEMAFQWDALSKIDDTADAIELKFKGGLVVAPNRAFFTDVDRQSFLTRARGFVQT